MASFSQHTYLLEYKASFSTSSIQPAWGVRISYIEDGVAKSIYNVTTTPPNTNSGSVDTFYVFSTSKEITALGASCLSVSGTLTSCTAGNHTSDIQTVNNSCTSDSSFIMEAVNKNRCVSGSVSKFNLIKIENFKTINNYSSTNNELKSCNSKSLIISTNCMYSLEYKIPSNSNWEELLTYGSNPSTVNISQSNFPGLKVGENVQLRVRYTSLKGETNTNAYSDILTYKIVGCSPQLQVPVVTQKTSCNYKADGGFTLNFNRNLNSEELVMTLYDGTDDSLIYDQEFTSTLTNNSGVYSYIWNKPLDAGSYRVKYQTHTGTGGIDEADDTWKTLEFSDSFTITPATPVDFQVTGSADQNCFEVNDGYIDISAKGESGRTFLYQLRKNNVIQIFNGTNWVNYTGSSADNETWFPFTNAQTTRISNLNKGAYSVKVRDSQKCLAKQ